MNKIDRGLKHVCPKCTTRYFDLNKEVVTCPKCGAEPPQTKLPRATPRPAKTSRTVFGRYPNRNPGAAGS
jgi:hypothetical protein